MKITILSGHLSGHGGTEKVITDLINNDKTTKYELFLGDLNSDNTWMKKIINTKIKYAARKSKILKLIFSTLYLLMTRSAIVLVLDTNYIKLAKICNVFRFHKYRIVSWIHFSLFDEPTVNIKNLKLADFHFAISSGIAKQMRDSGIQSQKIVTVFNPVFKQPIINRNVDDQLSLCFVGRIQFNGQKNLKELFNALIIYKGAWKLKIIGDGDKRDILDCKQFLKRNNLQSNVTWVGWVSNPWEHVNDTDYIVLSSKYEGFPLVLIEAISRGIPCISANCPTGTDDVISSDNGLLYESGSVLDLADKLEEANALKVKSYFEVNRVQKSLDKFLIDKYIDRMQKNYSMMLK